MAENYNVGEAIALGTNLQPDTSQPLTRGTGQWLQAEMNREAKRQKAELERQKRGEMLSASWQGDGSDIPFVNREMQRISNEAINGLIELGQSGDINNAARFKTQKLGEARQWKDIENQARKYISDVAGTNLQESAYIFANEGFEGLKNWAQQNKDLSQQLRVEGGYQTHSPIKLDLNMGDVFDRVINRSELPLNVEGDFKKMFENTYRAKGSFSSEDIATMASGMAQSVKNVENYYVQNRNELRPIVEQKAVQYINNGLDERSAIDKAKKEIVEERFNYELELRNSRMIRANKPQNINISVGGVTQAVAPLNISPYDPQFLRKRLAENDIFNQLRSGGTISGQIDKGAEIEKMVTQEFTNPYVIGMRTTPSSGYIGLDGVPITSPITVEEILMVTNKTTGEKKYYLYGTTQKNVLGQPTGQLLPLNQENFAKLSTNTKDQFLRGQSVLVDAIMKSLDIAGSEYKDALPQILGNVSINKKSGNVQITTPKNKGGSTNTGGGSITSQQFRALSLADRAKYKPNPNGNGTYILK
jgi:hypothetical protein